jgi:peptidoglycan/LPS O-acetylase OafA/YrhL
MYKKSIPKHIYIIVLLGIVLIIKNFDVPILTPFLTGAIAAFLSRNAFVKKWAKTNFASLFVLALLGVLIYSNANPITAVSQIVLGICFLLIASGNRLWGALDNSLTRLLGHISYGVYLSHGIILYITFELLIGLKVASAFTASEFCIIIVILTPVLISICYINYLFIEYPCMQMATKWTSWLRLKFKPSQQ